MTIQLRNEVIPASGATILDQANLIFIISASANVTLNIQQRGVGEVFASIPAGTKIKRVKQWSQAQIQGTPGTTVQFFYGLEFAREDETDFQTQIAVISGGQIVNVQGSSPNAITDHADIVLAAATNDTTSIVANAARKSIIIGSISTNTDVCRVRAHGSVNGGEELQPGEKITYFSQGAFDIIHPGPTAGHTVSWSEQT